MDCHKVQASRPTVRADISLVGADELRVLLFAIAGWIGTALGIGLGAALVGY